MQTGEDLAIARLQSLARIDLLAGWQWDGTAIALSGEPLYLRWPQGESRRFSQIWQRPELWQGLDLMQATLRLHLQWWAATATVWLDGHEIAAGDLFDRDLELVLEGQPTYQLDIDLTSPAHDQGAIMQTWLEISHPELDLGMFAAELAVIKQLLPNTDLSAIAAEILSLPEMLPNAQFFAALVDLRSRLLPLSPALKQQHVHLLGNAHIDVAWLWPLAETQDVVKRTFGSVLQLKSRFAALTFNQSTALSYAWIEADAELWPQVVAAIQDGWWEAIGGMWVEADTNLPNGESLIRQMLYGQLFLREHFGCISPIAWLPDSFGFSWQLPQLLSKAGFEVFVTQKLAWNDSTTFPHRVFYWQGADGSQILTYFCNGIGQGIDPIAIAQDLAQLKQESGLSQSLWLYGVGDHGGGPTAAMLERGDRWSQSPLFPTLRHSTAAQFFADYTPNDLPVWADELYLEFHRGTYTSKADQKRQNRQLEAQLRLTEMLSSLTWWHTDAPYPATALRQAWQAVLVNQFHDILPGSAIPEVFRDADAMWQDAQQSCDRYFPHPSSEPVADFSLFNPNPWPSTQLLVIDAVAVLAAGQPVPSQATAAGLLIFPEAIAPGESRLLQRSPTPCANPELPPLSVSPQHLENHWLRVDLSHGCVQQILDKRSGKTLLREPITYQFFEDQGQYWDAWNIDPDYENHRCEDLEITAVNVTEHGPLRSAIAVEARFRSSTWRLTWQLNAFEPNLTCQHQVDWQEEHILAKVAFPVNFSAPHATYEIPLATIQRSTTDPVKWEVPAQRWADLSTTDRGLAVLNDCKYGYDAQPNQLRLSLLRSPTWPHPTSDRGLHQFCYQLVPHAGDWRACTAAATCLNEPLVPLQSSSSWRYPVTLSVPNIAVLALKQAEDGEGLILRLAETWGRATDCQLVYADEIMISTCNLLEDTETTLSRPQIQFRAYEVKTLRLIKPQN